MTENAIVGFPRWTTKTTFSAGGGAWDPVYPVTNLGVLPLAQVARTTDDAIASTRFLATIDRDRGVRLLGICRHNLSLSALQRVSLSSGPACTFTVNTTTNVVSAAGHELDDGSQVIPWTTAADLPVSTPQIAEDTIYYAGTVVPAVSFKLYPTEADALAETNAIDFSDTGSGTHTILGPIIYRSDWEDVWPIVYSDEDLEWEDPACFTGKYSLDEIEGYVWTRPIWLAAIYLTRAVRVEIDDTANPDGFVQIGLCEISAGWQVPANPALGAQYGFRFRSTERESWGGIKTFERRPKPRVARGSFPLIDRNSALGRWFEHLRQGDLVDPFLWFPQPDVPRHWLRESFLARNVDPGLSAMTEFEADDLPYALEEVL